MHLNVAEPYNYTTMSLNFMSIHNPMVLFAYNSHNILPDIDLAGTSPSNQSAKLSWTYSVIYYTYIPGTLGPCFHYRCSVYGICKWSDTLWPVGRVRLFADYTISSSSLCRLIWGHWTTKMLVRYMLPSVCLRLRQFSQSSFIRFMGLCVFSFPNSPVMIVRMCTLSYCHHQIGSMNH